MLVYSGSVSTASSPRERQSIWQSPKFQRRALWVSGAVLVAGIIVFLIAFVGNTGKSYDTPLTDQPAKDVSKVPNSVPLPDAAKVVARRFILTAVARANLRDAWRISGPHIRQGMSLEEWLQGNIPVVPYPAEEIDFAPMKIDYSYRDQALIEVALLPKKGSKYRPQIFFVTLVRTGPPGKKQWVVDGWVPRASPTVPSGSENNAASGG